PPRVDLAGEYARHNEVPVAIDDKAVALVVRTAPEALGPHMRACARVFGNESVQAPWRVGKKAPAQVHPAHEETRDQKIADAIHLHAVGAIISRPSQSLRPKICTGAGILGQKNIRPTGAGQSTAAQIGR